MLLKDRVNVRSTQKNNPYPKPEGMKMRAGIAESFTPMAGL